MKRLSKIALATAATAVALVTLLIAGTAVVSANKVVDIDAKALDEIQTGNSENVWVIRFTSQDGCKGAPECESFDKAAVGLEGSVKLANIKDGDAAAKHGISKYPGYVAWVPAAKKGDKGAFTAFTAGDDTTAGGFVKAAVGVARDLALKRAGGDTKKEEKQGGGGGGEEPPKHQKGKEYEGSEVLEVSDDEFDEELKKANNPMFVIYYAPWCGHCKNAAPHLKEAAATGTGIKVVAIDASGRSRHATKQGVQGFPTFKFYRPNEPEQTPEDYNGGRDASGFTAFLESKADQYGTGKPLVVEQFAEQAALDKCLDSKKLLCVVFALPHVAFTGAAGRNALLENVVGKVAKKFRARSASMGWISGGDHGKFESGFAIEGNLPTFVAISKEKKVYNVYQGQFNADDIAKHLTKLLEGRMSVQKLKKDVPALSKGASLWDGKDYVETD
jgi:protein disulfide-isomerase A6